MRSGVKIVLVLFALSLICLTGGHVAIAGTDVGVTTGVEKFSK